MIVLTYRYGHLVRILHWCTDQSMTAALVPAKYSSTAQSLVFSAQSVGGILANVLCAWLVERVNLRSVFQITSYFAFAGVLLFWATVILPAAKAGKDK